MTNIKTSICEKEQKSFIPLQKAVGFLVKLAYGGRHSRTSLSMISSGVITDMPVLLPRISTLTIFFG